MPVWFLPESLVRMNDGTQRPCRELIRGDIVSGGHRILCVVKTLVHYADIVRLWTSSSHTPPPGGFTVHEGTEAHPVTRVYTDAIYNFVLDDGQTLEVNGITTHTLEKYGLANQPGWQTGLVVLNEPAACNTYTIDDRNDVREVSFDIPLVPVENDKE